MPVDTCLEPVLHVLQITLRRSNCSAQPHTILSVLFSFIDSLSRGCRECIASQLPAGGLRWRTALAAACAGFMCQGQQPDGVHSRRAQTSAALFYVRARRLAQAAPSLDPRSAPQNTPARHPCSALLKPARGRHRNGLAPPRDQLGSAQGVGTCYHAGKAGVGADDGEDPANEGEAGDPAQVARRVRAVWPVHVAAGLGQMSESAAGV